MSGMKKLENFFNLLQVLSYGKAQAKTADQLFNYFNHKSISEFKRKLRLVSQEARLQGHWVVGDENGYYLALTKEEWQAYRNKRLSAINTELKAIANCDKISFSDLIKNVYAVSPTDNNYSLF
jgi:hypothetical protein